MVHLILAINKHMEFVDFTMPMVLATNENKVLPYPALIIKLLEVNKITPWEDETVVKIKRHSPGQSLRSTTNDFIRFELSKGKELVKEIRQQVFSVNSNLQKLSEEIFNQKRPLAQVIWLYFPSHWTLRMIKKLKFFPIHQTYPLVMKIFLSNRFFKNRMNWDCRHLANVFEFLSFCC